MKRKRHKLVMQWTPFVRAANLAEPGIETFVNCKYQVRIRQVPLGIPMVQLSIKRIDQQPIHDWRDLQRIKNELVGPENEGVELYPAESRLVDAANQYWLYVAADPKLCFPIGFTQRWVNNISEHGSVQRPFPPGQEPADCKSLAEFARLPAESSPMLAQALDGVEEDLAKALESQHAAGSTNLPLFAALMAARRKLHLARACLKR